jgi:asparagine synthase (glutamine-hydrolysing)
MCGIAGYFGSSAVPESRIQDCLARMHRRGPDHAGARHWRTRAGRHVNLLHSRLGIIDLEERSNQPFNLGSKWITFNGEIYNYLELRKELENHHSFLTQSDTEVLLAAIEKDGKNACSKFEGMWAFAIYDENDDSLILSRDRFGEKPLYLYRDSSGLYFGSEVKFIFALLGRKLPVNTNHVLRFMVNGYKALYKTSETFFEGIVELEPATQLRLDAKGVETRKQYWIPGYSPNDDMTYEDAVEGARRALVRSMELRLRSDVPMAFCMSGGVDSNALISIARRMFNYDVHGFTIANPDQRYDEQELVDTAVQDLGIRHTYIPVETKEFLPKLRTLVNQHDAPVYTITYFTHWMLEQSIAKHGYKISISGTAADELFTGYYDHHLAYLAEIRAEPALYKTALKAWKDHIRPIVRNPHLRDPDLFSNDPGFRKHLWVDGDDFSGSLRFPWSEGFTETIYTDRSLLRNRMLNELFHEGVRVILHEDDLNAMYFSIENRSPFLDRGLFEFCYQIPSRLLMRDGYAKIILRDAMKGIVPAPIITNRRKVGFNAGILSFLDADNSEVREELLAESPIYEHVRRDSIQNLISKSELNNAESKFLFAFINSKMFLEEFL